MQQQKDVLLTAMSDILFVVFVSEVFHRVNRWYFKDSRNSMITGGMLLISKSYFNFGWCTVLNQMLYLFLRKRLISLNRVSNVNHVFLTIKLVFIRIIFFSQISTVAPGFARSYYSMLENTCKDICSGSKYENTPINFTRTHNTFFRSAT